MAAPFLAAQAAVKHMPAGGRIINIGSNVAERSVFPGFSPYAMSKTALIGLTKALGRELSPRAITVNLVNPGPTDTDLNPADGPGADTSMGSPRSATTRHRPMSPRRWRSSPARTGGTSPGRRSTLTAG